MHIQGHSWSNFRNGRSNTGENQVTYVHTGAYTHMYTHMYTHINTKRLLMNKMQELRIILIAYTCVHSWRAVQNARTYINIYTHIHTCIHTFIHSYIHTYWLDVCTQLTSSARFSTWIYRALTKPQRKRTFPRQKKVWMQQSRYEFMCESLDAFLV